MNKSVKKVYAFSVDFRRLFSIKNEEKLLETTGSKDMLSVFKAKYILKE